MDGGPPVAPGVLGVYQGVESTRQPDAQGVLKVGGQNRLPMGLKSPHQGPGFGLYFRDAGSSD